MLLAECPERIQAVAGGYEDWKANLARLLVVLGDLEDWIYNECNEQAC